MKRFLLFASAVTVSECTTGWQSFVDSYELQDDALDSAKQALKWCAWWHIVDLMQEKIIHRFDGGQHDTT